jgi:hypothetical protein
MKVEEEDVLQEMKTGKSFIYIEDEVRRRVEEKALS